MKKILLFTLGALLILGFGTSAAASTATQSDMPLTNWSFKDIKEQCLDLMSSYRGDASDNPHDTTQHHRYEYGFSKGKIDRHSEIRKKHHNQHFHHGHQSHQHHHSKSSHHHCMN